MIHETETITFVDLSRPASSDVEDDGPVSVRDALVFLDFAHFASPHTLPRSVSYGTRRHFLPPELPRPGKLVDVRVCHVNSPDDFYIQLVCDCNSCSDDDEDCDNFYVCLLIMSPLRRHIFVCFMAKLAFLGGFSALAPYTGVGPI